MIVHVNATPLAVMHRTTEWPEHKLTLAAKGVFDLTGAPLDEPISFAPEDLVPLKRHTDLLVSGTAPPNDKHRLTLGTRRFEATAMSGFAPLPLDDAKRLAKLGTFDETYAETRWPYYPADFDPSYFNAAPAALQIDEPRGDESIAFDGTTAQLPALRVRAFVHTAEIFEEVPLVLDTVHLDLDAGRLSLVWRAFTDERPIEHLYLATEPLADEQLSVEHHHRAFQVALLEEERAAEQRQARKQRMLRANDNEPDEDTEAEEVAELAAVLQQSGAPPNVLAAIDGKTTMLSAVAAISDLVDPNPKTARELAQPALDSIRAQLEAAGEDPSALDFGDEEDEAESLWTPQRVAACARAGESMAGVDLRGLDLSGLDLTGACFHDALMAKVSLRGATLYQADLSSVTMPDADLTGAVFGHANLTDADLTRAKAAQIDLRDAKLEGTLFDAAAMPEALLDGAHAVGASFRKADLTGARFERTDLSTAQLDEAILHGVSFAEATLIDTSLEGARGDDVSFARANLFRLRAGNQAALFRADLREATANESSFFGADLREAKLTLCDLRRADLSRARLDGVALDGANCADADFTESGLENASLLGANFAGACFTGADLSRADARKANFYEAELWRANTKGLRLDEAHLAMSKLAPKADAS